MSENETMTAPRGKGFTVFRGDTARFENNKIKGTLYEIGKSLRPSIGRSWTTSHKKAKEFACQYAQNTQPPTVPIIYRGVANKLKRGLFWDSEREVYIVKDTSRLNNIEIIDSKDCEEIMRTLSK